MSSSTSYYYRAARRLAPRLGEGSSSSAFFAPAGIKNSHRHHHQDHLSSHQSWKTLLVKLPPKGNNNSSSSHYYSPPTPPATAATLAATAAFFVPPPASARSSSSSSSPSSPSPASRRGGGGGPALLRRRGGEEEEEERRGGGLLAVLRRCCRRHRSAVRRRQQQRGGDDDEVLFLRPSPASVRGSAAASAAQQQQLLLLHQHQHRRPTSSSSTCRCNNSGSHRHFVAAAAASPSASLKSVAAPTFRPVPFAKEDIGQVLAEVPELQFYYTGEELGKENPYKDIPLDQSILPPSTEFPAFAATRPELQFSKLENGLRIASVDRGGLTASLGLFVHAGSRFEDPSNFGLSHMVENLAFQSTAHLSWLRTIKTVEAAGATAGCSVGREHIVYSAEFLRPSLPVMLPLLTGNVIFPRLLPWEMSSQKERLLATRQRLEQSPDALVTELLHTTAWHNNTLGNKLFATERSLQYYDADSIRDFLLKHFSPQNMVLVAVNADHDELCKWAMRAFVDYNAIPPTPRTVDKPVYTGGDVRVENSSPMAHLAIAFETPGGWNSDDLVPLTVLQNLMGGGGSFSTGGPGKGMYTRLFLNVLNRHEWVESCMAFNSQYTDSGIFGFYMTASPSEGEGMVKVMAEEFRKMGTVTREELNRAKASLKSSIWMNLECRQIVLEDVARQLLMSGRVVGGEEFCKAVDSVTEADIKRVATKLLSGPPTVVAHGDIGSIPHQTQILSMLGSSSSGK